MKALIMAAGRGTRISRYIEGKPKCMVDIGGIRLIEYTVKELMKRGCSEIGIVLGYRSELLRELLKDYPVKVYYNYFYEVTNSIASAWFAKDFLDDDMLMMNADVYVEPAIMDRVFELPDSTVLLTDGSRKDEADYKFYYEDGRLLKYGKQLEGKDISGEYVGIAKIGHDFLEDFCARLQKLVESGSYQMWWEDVLYSFVGERPVYVEEVDGKFWAEVDFIEDYERILAFRGVKEKKDDIVKSISESM